MELETWAVANLTSDPNNVRTHDKTNLDAIAASLNKFGQRKPIVITADGVVLAGNGTLAAAKQLGWKEITVTVAPADWDTATAKAYALADNRSAELAAWDQSALATQLVELETVGWDLADLGFGKVDAPNEEDLAAAFDALGADKGEMEQITFTLHKFQAETIKGALETSKAMGDFGDTGNTNSNGNALARIVELWLGQNVG